MRILPIVDDAGRINPLWPFILIATKRWPEDAGSVAVSTAALQAEEASRLNGHPPSEAFRKLQEMIVQPMSAGPYAGEVLLALLALDLKFPERCSVNKAVHVVSTLLDGKKNSKGRPFPIDKANIQKWWGTHKNVAHLWAADKCMKAATPKEANASAQVLHLSRTIGTAAALLRLVDNGSEKLRAALGSNWNPWRVPCQEIPLTLKFSLPAELMGAVDSYKARVIPK